MNPVVTYLAPMKTTVFALPVALLSLHLVLAPEASARPLRSSEELRFLPGVAAVRANGGELLLEGRAVHPQRDSWKRYLFLKTLKLTLGLSMTSEEAETFETRGNLFLATKAPGVDVEVGLSGGGSIYVERTGDSGYFSAAVPLMRGVAREGVNRFTFESHDGRSFEGKFLALGEQGISVISDIDDTVKVTDVKVKSELLKNTFLRPYRAIPGMADLYRELAARGASFHYVSSSPAQLAPLLQAFFTAEGFPAEYSLHLRPVDIDPLDFYDYPKLLELFAGSESVKVSRLEGILKLFPRRQFVLVGDSTEEDPETYARLLTKFGDRIKAVWIRDLTGATEDSPRYLKLFTGQDRAKLKVYEDPARLRPYLP